MLTLPLNPDGLDPECVKETTHPIKTGLAENESNLFVAQYGIFHPAGLKVTHVDTGTVLALGSDYYLTYYSRHLKVNYELDGYAGVVLTNRVLTGNLKIKASYMGGGYVRHNTSVIPELLVNSTEMPEQLFWDDLIDAPDKAYPTGHKLPAENISTGYEDMVTLLWLQVKATKELAKHQQGGHVPLGGMTECIEPNDNLATDTWIPVNGQVLMKVDHPVFFAAMGITNLSYTLPARSGHWYLRIL